WNHRYRRHHETGNGSVKQLNAKPILKNFGRCWNTSKLPCLLGSGIGNNRIPRTRGDCEGREDCARVASEEIEFSKGGDRGLSRFDQTQRFVQQVLYRLSFREYGGNPR